MKKLMVLASMATVVTFLVAGLAGVGRGAVGAPADRRRGGRDARDGVDRRHDARDCDRRTDFRLHR